MVAPSELRSLADGVHVVEAPQRFLGLEVGARMTVLDTGHGLLIHAPVGVAPSIVDTVGTAKWVLAPNLMHHLYVGPWIASGLPAWAAPGLPDKRRDLDFVGVIDGDEHPFGPNIETHTLRCFDMTREVIVFHRPSRTLVVTDLVFNISAQAPWMTRAIMRCLGGYPGCRVTLLERFGMRRDLARRDLSAIMRWDFDRLVMAHGSVIETGGKAALRSAFHWLALPELPASDPSSE